MHRFYEGCLSCAFQEQVSYERCFECAETMAIREDWIHSLGFYYPRCLKEHENSKWSKAILMAKRKSSILLVFGKLMAFYLDGLEYLKPYILTYVPDFQEGQLFNLPRMQFLATLCFSKLQDKKWVNMEKVIVQVKTKRRKQRHCHSDKERSENVHGIYAVLDYKRVEGKNIVLMDDVFTSGATMKECASSLLEADAKEVVGITLARTFRKGESNGNQN